MKVSREKRAAHRAAIVASAARLFREHGPEGVGVAEITQAAGLTHGGFYGHFASKEALLGEAVETALTESSERLAAICAESGLKDYARSYLSEAHVSDRAAGCVVAALGSDVARQSTEVRAACARGLRRFVDAASAAPDAARMEAIAILAGLIGAVVMARAVRGVDDALAEEALAAVRATLIGDTE